MATGIASLGLALVLSATGGGLRGWLFGEDLDAPHSCQSCGHAHHQRPPAPNAYPPEPSVHTGHHQPGGRIVAPGPGPGWGFPNNNPDGYGWVDYGSSLPLGANRTAEYFFRRHFAVTPQLMFFPQYYNPYIQRGQRYIPYAGCGGEHPFGGVTTGSAMTPYSPATDPVPRPVVNTPAFTGRTPQPVDMPPAPPAPATP